MEKTSSRRKMQETKKNGEIKIDKRDDYITTKTFDRNFIFSNLNKLGNIGRFIQKKN
ncbi:hypothetical protein D3C87_666080 [compost metagenome]